MTIKAYEALAGIVGWEDATVSKLDGGLSNRTYRVSTANRVAVLKIDDRPRERPLNTRSEEAAVQTCAANAGLAAPVILAGNNVYLTEFVEGMVWKRDDLHDTNNLALVAAALKRVHALPLTGRSFDGRAAARRYVTANVALDSATVRRCETIIAEIGISKNLRCCHNDLVAENLITAPELMFLDWEYACDNDPFFDLATIAEHHQLDDEQVHCLLESYLGSDDEDYRVHLEKQRLLYLALLCLWLASRFVIDDVELQQVVARLFTRNS